MITFRWMEDTAGLSGQCGSQGPVHNTFNRRWFDSHILLAAGLAGTKGGASL